MDLNVLKSAMAQVSCRSNFTQEPAQKGGKGFQIYTRIYIYMCGEREREREVPNLDTPSIMVFYPSLFEL